MSEKKVRMVTTTKPETTTAHNQPDGKIDLGEKIDPRHVITIQVKDIEVSGPNPSGTNPSSGQNPNPAPHDKK